MDVKITFLVEKENYDMKVTDKEKAIIKGMKVGPENEAVTNPYSGVEVELCPEAVALYDIIKGCEISLRENRDPYSDRTAILFDTAIDIFIRNWPKEYMTLLD